jgi:hypothetical protein
MGSLIGYVEKGMHMWYADLRKTGMEDTRKAV